MCCSGDGLPCLLADLLLVETTKVDEVVGELAVPDVQGLKSVLVGEIANKLGLCTVPLRGHSRETLVEVVEPLVLCDTSMLAVSKETVNEFLCKDTYIKDIVALADKYGYDGFDTASSTTSCCGASWVCHIVESEEASSMLLSVALFSSAEPSSLLSAASLSSSSAALPSSVALLSSAVLSLFATSSLLTCWS